MNNSLKESIIKILKNEEVSLEELVVVTDALIDVAESKSDISTDTIYNTLATIEDAVVIPAVYSVELPNNTQTTKYDIFSKHIELPLKEVQQVMYKLEFVKESNRYLKRLTGVQAYIGVANVIPSSFPTVDLTVLANSILRYNVEYKQSVIQDIVTNGLCLVNVAETSVEYLAPMLTDVIIE